MFVSKGQHSFVPRVFKEEAGHQIQKGDHARLSSFIGAIAIADLVKTTLGPKGMDKMLVSGRPGTADMSGDVTVTNDGATILKKIPIDNPAAKILVNISMAQDDEVGDGTTSVVVFAGELLREAENLVIMKKIHPSIIIRGWRQALQVSLQALQRASMDHKSEAEIFVKDLTNIAKTTLSSKIVTSELDFFADLCVKAVLKLKGSIDLDMIQIIKKAGGQMKDSFLDEGFILDKCFGLGQGTYYKNPKIMVTNTGMDSDKIKIFGAKVKVHSIEKIAQIESAEKMKMRMKIEKVLRYKPDIVVNRQLIYDYPEQLFTAAGIGSIEHADFNGVERLAAVLGAQIMSTFDDLEEDEEKKSEKKVDLEEVQSRYLGTCEEVSEIMIGEDNLIRFSGVRKGEACTIVLRGGSSHLLDEMERSIHDALCVLTQTIRNSRVVLGGGASEMMIADAVEKEARHTSGKEAIAMDSFASALRSIPYILADNAGLDASGICTELRAEHAKGKYSMGVDVMHGSIGDMREYGVFEAFKSKSQSIISGHEAAEMILRVDDIVKCAPRQRTDHGH